MAIKDKAPVPPVRRKKMRKSAKKHYAPIGELERVTENRARAFELRKEGLSYRAIGKVMGVSLTTAFEYIQAELNDLREKTVEAAQDVRDMELQRCDEMMAGLWKKGAITGDPAIVMTVLKVMERRSRLLGLDAPSKAEVLNALIPITPDEAAKLSDAELQKRITALANRMAASLPPAIDTTAIEVK